ncbi:MAG: hypothetical protein H6722_14910 [Sandaracinus sp.]|nr:hypothetical protein [Sandaracinus sp.]
MSAARIEKLESLLARVQRNRDLPREAAEPKRPLPSTPLELAVESAELSLPSDVPPPMDEAVAVATPATATPAAGTPRSPSFAKLEIPAAALDDEPELVVSEASGEFDVDVDDGEELPTIPPPPDEPVAASPASPGFKPVELPPAELEIAVVAPEPPATPPVVAPPAPVAAPPAVAVPAVAAPAVAEPIAATPPVASAAVAKVVAAAPVAAPKTFGELLDRALSLRPR